MDTSIVFASSLKLKGLSTRVLVHRKSEPEPPLEENPIKTTPTAAPKPGRVYHHEVFDINLDQRRSIDGAYPSKSVRKRIRYLHMYVCTLD